MPDSHEINVRVRYAETDRMGLLHHANYFIYFEMARTEMLRSRGISYREIEDSGHFLVIIDIGCKFKKPAYYDDLLTIRTTVARVTHVKIVHEYHVFAGRRAPGRGPFDAGVRRPRGEAPGVARDPDVTPASSRPMLGGLLGLGIPAGGPIEVVVDGPGDLGAEAVAGVVGDPSLVFVVVAHDADGDRPARGIR